jgi:diaminohydroxyphosphoribosylaminopyrimidine deaminase / 5-amino-6-(5-phosphoribosylamino)uracil reductase
VRNGETRFSDQDVRFMRQALRLAERGRGTTHPNPMVGAVLVSGGRVLATGYHQRAGGPHAEIAALQAAGGRAPGGTLYVTLEPCCHTGRTGPCTESLLQAGLARVVIGCIDENPKVCGKGVARLRRGGLRVDVGCLEAECQALNRAFFVWISRGRPLVTLKAAATLDGFIAPAGANRASTIHWITGQEARAEAHALRGEHDAILVGAGTVLADNPRLTARPGPPILRVVLDGRLRTPPGARLFSERKGPPPLVVGGLPARLEAAERRRLERRQRALTRAGAEVLLLPARRDHQVPLHRVLEQLARRGVQSLLVEGGSQVHSAFIANRLVDRVAFFFAPRLQGAGVPLSGGERGLPWAEPLRLGPVKVRRLAGDILLSADVLLTPHARLPSEKHRPERRD